MIYGFDIMKCLNLICDSCDFTPAFLLGTVCKRVGVLEMDRGIPLLVALCVNAID